MEKHPLHLKNPELQKSPEVERAVKRQEKKQHQKIPNDPTARLETYVSRLENIFLHPDQDTRRRLVERYRPQIYDALIIKPENFPESYFELQKRVAREQGYGDVEITPEQREQMIAIVREDQKYSLDAWIDYLTSEDATYPAWFKYYAWNQVIKLSQFDKERGEFKKRTDTTVAPFPDIYREPLAQIADRYKRVKDNNKDAKAREDFDKKFPSLYAELTSKSLAASMENREETKGQWIKYEQNKTGEAEKLFASLQGKGTGWCTAGQSTAQTQIESGDFYVYYTNDIEGQPTQPRLAIRMEGANRIGEVRGVLPHQNVEPLMQEVLDKKLEDFGTEADVYRQKSADMKKLTELEHRREKGEEFTKEDLAFLYEIDHKIEGFGYEKDPRIEELKAGRDIKNDLVLITGYQAEEISLTKEEALSGGIKYHYGDLYLSSLTSAEGLNLPQTIGGNLDLRSLTSAEGLNLPQTIGGGLDLHSLTSAEGLNLPQTIGGGLDLRSLTSAEGLNLPQTIGGNFYLYSLTSAEGLNLPQTIGGNLNLHSLTSAEGLNLPQTIGGGLDLHSLTSAEGLNLPQTIGGGLDLRSLTSAEGLNLPQTIGGELDLRSLTSAEGLNLPQTIGGHLNLYSLTSAEGLNLPQTIGGNLYLFSLTSAEGLNLPQTIGGDLSLRSLTSAEGLNLPQTIGGNLYLSSLTSAEGLNLPQTIGGDLNLRSLTSAEGLNLPQTIGGELDLRSLTSAEGLNLPQTIGGHLNLYSLTSAEGLNLPQTIGGNLYLYSLTSAEGLNLPQTIGGNLNLHSLTSAEGLNLPQTIGGGLDLHSLTSAEGLNLPQTIGGGLDLRSLTSAEGLNLPQTIGGNLNLRSLTSAEGLNLPEEFTGILYHKSLKQEDLQILIEKYPKEKLKRLQ